MAANLVHFGADDACRTLVLQSAGFVVKPCSSIDALAKILEREQADAVVIPQRPELKVDSVVSVVHSRPSTSVILFAEEPGQPHGTEADLVIPALTPPWEWVPKIAELIAQSRALRAKSSLRAEVSLMMNESRAPGHRMAKQVERVEEIGKHSLRNKPTNKSGN